MTRRLPGILPLLLILAACGGGSRVPPEASADPDKYLFGEGTTALNDRKWLRAREFFRQLIDTYPQSPFRADAKLGIGDTYLGEGTTEAKVLAINEFREFLTFFPTHERADYAQYKVGMAHYFQMLSPQRDQTETKEAIREFETFVQRYPNSALLGEVQKYLRESKDRLGLSEFQVGLFYFRNRWYPGAIDRLKQILDRDPEYTFRDAVYFHLAESLARTNQGAEALPYFERLLKEFERSEYLEETRKRVLELKGPEAKPSAARNHLWPARSRSCPSPC